MLLAGTNDTAGYRIGECQSAAIRLLRVIFDRVGQDYTLCQVRFASNSDRICAPQRTDAKGQEPTFRLVRHCFT
jgi:hypothetical protein